MIFLFLKQLVKVTYVRGSLLIPFILMLIYLGAFAEKNAFPDLILVLVFGAFGWLLEKFKWPRPPLILGLVLGGLAESRLFLSMGNYGLSWIYRPTVLVLIAVTLFGAFYPVVKGRLQKRKLRMSEALPAESAAVTVKPKGRVNKWSAIFALGIVAVLALALWQSRNFNVRAGLFPWAIGFPLIALALPQFVRELWARPVEVRWDGSPRTRNQKYHRTWPTAGQPVCSVGSSLILWLSGCLVSPRAAPCAVLSSLNLGQKKSG